MAKCLLVGDVHATPDELDDCDKLVGLIEAELKSQVDKYDYLVFLGDQAHNHAVLNVHVLNFWKQTFLRLRPYVGQIVCLVGNHDLPGNTGTNTINSMSTLDNLCLVVEDLIVLDDMLFVGYQHKNQSFIDICQKYSDVNYVICHQTFNGARYENGFPALDGIDVELLPPNQKYLSGHIHTFDVFGNITYIGAPRWRSLTDAKVAVRCLWRFHSDTGLLKTACNTNSVCRRKAQYDLTPETAFPGDLFKSGDLVYFNLIGPQVWIDKIKYDYRGWNGLVIKSFPTDSKPVKVKESEGIDKALMKFLDSSTITTPKDTIKKLIEERIWMK